MQAEEPSMWPTVAEQTASGSCFPPGSTHEWIR